MFKALFYLLFITTSQFLISINVLATEVSQPNTLDGVLKEHDYIQVGETTFSILFWDLYNSNKH